MRFFWKWRQQEHNNIDDSLHKGVRHDVEKAITRISARLKFLEAFTAELAAELPANKRTRVLQNLREVVREQKIFPPPTYVPPGDGQEYYDEMRRAVEVLIESSEDKLRRP
jgi:hypothetical protein